MTHSVRSAFLLSILLFPGCQETVLQPGDDGYPEKLYTHEVLFDAAIAKQRRDDLMQQVPAGSLVFVTTNDLYTRNGDVDYDFRPSSTFFYLTGFEEPNAVAVIRRKLPPGAGCELIMFVEERSGSQVQWLGNVVGPEGVVEQFGADSGYVVDEWPARVSQYFASGGVSGVHANLPENETVADVFASLSGTVPPVSDLRTIVDRMRVVKSAPEVESVRRAAEISVQAFGEAIASIGPGMYEYEVQAIMELVLRLNGCPRTSFPTIVASGPNIVTLHYTANSRSMQSGDLVMIDYGAEYGYYAADVTRTLPISGAFTTSQAVVYDIVKGSYDAVIAAAKPGVSYATLSALNRETLINGMVQAGIISGNAADIIASGQHRLYIPAGLAHCIGLDVHDPWPLIDNDRVLAPGMMLAIEPHLYLNPNDATVAAPYRGICARIEDDILITSAGCEVLSKGLPTLRVDLERMMHQP